MTFLILFVSGIMERGRLLHGQGGILIFAQYIFQLNGAKAKPWFERVSTEETGLGTRRQT